MTADAKCSLREARSEDAEATYCITKASIAGLAGASYRNQIENWMGKPTPAFYEELMPRDE